MHTEGQSQQVYDSIYIEENGIKREDSCKAPPGTQEAEVDEALRRNYEALQRDHEALQRDNQGLKQTVASIAKELDDAKELAESRQNDIDDQKIIIDAYRKRTSNAKEKVKVEAANEGEGGTSNPVADETATTLNEHGMKRKAGEMEADGGHES